MLEEAPSIEIPESQVPESDQAMQPEKPKSPKKNITQYDWMPITKDGGEFNYLEQFLTKHKRDHVDQDKLDLKSGKIDIIEKLTKAYAKDGRLMSKKNPQDQYDLQDTWVDDSVEIGQGEIALNQITPTLTDFVCHQGGIETFKKSKYYEERVAMAKSINDSKKKSKSAKKSGKDPSRRKAEEVLARPPEELKKNKKNKEDKEDAPINVE